MNRAIQELSSKKATMMGLIFVAGYSVYSSRAHYSFELRQREFKELDRKWEAIRAHLNNPQWYEATEKKIVNSKVADGGTLREEIQMLLHSPGSVVSTTDKASDLNIHNSVTINSSMPASVTSNSSPSPSPTASISKAGNVQGSESNKKDSGDNKPKSYNIKL